jgi:hypothetical protein
MYAGSQLMFAIFWKQFRRSDHSRAKTTSIIEAQCQSVHFARDVFDSKLRALHKKAMIESKLMTGAENFVKVAAAEQRTKAFKELEESRSRLEIYQALVSAYKAFLPKVPFSDHVSCLRTVMSEPIVHPPGNVVLRLNRTPSRLLRHPPHILRQSPFPTMSRPRQTMASLSS